MPSKKRSTPFPENHAIQYWLEISFRDPNTKVATSFMCRFCRFYGREEKIGQKRNPTSATKGFKAPFRPALYIQHLQGQHPAKWEEYQGLSATEKDFFFTTLVSVRNSLHSHFDGAGDQVFLDIDVPIVDTIIRKQLFYPVADLATIEKAFRSFQPMHAAANKNSVTHYRVHIKNVKLLRLIIGQVAFGSSFRLASHQITIIREELSLGFMNGYNDAKVAQFVRVAAAASLQKISELLKRTWGFSVAFDSSTIEATSYFDVRVRFAAKARLYCFHLLALPLHRPHTGQLMLEVFQQAINAIIPGWEDYLLSTCSDGASNMLDHVRGIFTRIDQRSNAAGHRLIRFWCGAHQFDLVVKKVVRAYFSESWYSTLTDLIGYLRRKTNLINEMSSKCPKVATTRWLSLGNFLPWFGKHRARIIQYLEEKNPDCKPPVSWWISLHALRCVTDEMNILFMYLQYEGLLILQQRAAFDKFIVCIREKFLLRGPLLSVQIASLADEAKLFNGSFVVLLSDISYLIRVLGSSVAAMLDCLSEDERYCILAAFGALLVELAEVVSKISPERDGDNLSVATSFPPMLPKAFASMIPSSFVEVVIRFCSRLEKIFGESYIDALEEEHRFLRDQYLRDTLIKDMLDSMKDTVKYHNGWVFFQSQYSKLCEFSSGLATIYPGTTRVESDFSVLVWEKNEYRSALIDFSLEGIMHSKYFKPLQSIS